MKKIERQQNNLMFSGASPVQRETITQQYDVIRVYFTEEGIGGVSQHIEELEAIRSAGPNDILEIHVADNPGGSAGTIVTIVHALLSTPAHTVCILNGNSASAATFIPLVCAETIVGPYATMMCHSCAGGVGGIMANQERSAVFFSKLYSELMDDIYANFLTESELDDLKKGLEIYLDADAIQERLERRAELLQEENDEEGSSCDTTCENFDNPCEECYKLPEIKLEEEDMPTPKKSSPSKKSSSKKDKALVVGSGKAPVVSLQQKERFKKLAKNPKATAGRSFPEVDLP